MSKTLRVTLWVDPAQHQIVRYSFDNLGFAFMPGRWMFRLEDVTASMSCDSLRGRLAAGAD